MKHYFSFLLVSLLITSAFTSCSKGGDDIRVVSTFSAKVDSATFVSTAVTSRIDTSTTMANKDQLTISANNGTESIIAVLTDYNESLPLGTYNITNGRALVVYSRGVDDLARTGQVVITSASRSFVNGTINFTTRSGVQVSQGKFSVEVQQ